MQNNPELVVQTEPARVLVVDDDLGMRHILRQLLEQDGHQVLEAANGQDALKLYKRCSPDLVLLDAVMPVMDGFTCCQQLCALNRSFLLPVLMITSLDDEISVNRAFKAGAIDYVTKPINQAVLRHRVHRIMQQSRLMKQVRQMNETLDDYAQNLSITVREQTAKLQRSL